jgi:hypothetical protein
MARVAKSRKITVFLFFPLWYIENIRKAKETKMTQIESIETLFASHANHGSRAYHVPIAMRNEVLAAYKSAGIKIRVRYRGPRLQSIGRIMRVEVRDKVYTYRRTRHMAMQDCMMQDAKTFSVYTRK